MPALTGLPFRDSIGTLTQRDLDRTLHLAEVIRQGVEDDAG